MKTGLEIATGILSPTQKAEEMWVCTDSKSLIQRLQSGPAQQQTANEAAIWSLLTELRHVVGHITCQWVPAHCGLELNERADTLANEGSGMDQSETLCDINSAKACIRRYVSKEWKNSIKHPFYPKNEKPLHEKERHLCRKTRTVLAQLRCAGHCPILGSYLHRIGGSPSSECAKCGADEDDLPHLLLDCPAAARARAIFLGPFPTLNQLWSDPAAVAAFLRNCGRLKTRPPVDRQQPITQRR
jgi:hypothetical protein